MNKSVIITGGTGFIGSNIIKNLSNDYNFVNIGRNKSNLCEDVYWDFKSRLNYKCRNEIHSIIHCAAITGNKHPLKSDYIDVNLKSTLYLLDYCVDNRISKFIYISTGGVYGYSDEKLNESGLCNPIDIYSMSKYFSEKLCDLYRDKISIIIVRLFFPYGNGQQDRLFSNLVNSITDGKEITLNKNGQPIINPIHINDVVSIIRELVKINCEGIYNLCGDECISIEELSAKIALYAKVEEPHFVYKDDSVANLIGSNEKIHELVQYKLQVDLDTGIKMYLNHYNKV